MQVLVGWRPTSEGTLELPHVRVVLVNGSTRRVVVIAFSDGVIRHDELHLLALGASWYLGDDPRIRVL